jgi:hypothetical protein
MYQVFEPVVDGHFTHIHSFSTCLNYSDSCSRYIGVEGGEKAKEINLKSKRATDLKVGLG